MGDLLPACHNWPPIMIGAACAIAAYLIVKWARSEEEPLPPWRWGDTPRRPEPLAGLTAHVVGVFVALFAIVYAIQDPICG